MKIAPPSVTSTSPAGAAELEQDQDDERVLEEIVVEGSEELAPEERREAARSHESAKHVSSPPAARVA